MKASVIVCLFGWYFISTNARPIDITIINFTNMTISDSTNNTCEIDTLAALCNYHGICNEDEHSCNCNEGYITHNPTNETFCNYKQKSALTAFVLELFIGFISGAGYFYIERYGLGNAQVALCWIGIGINICIARYIHTRSNATAVTHYRKISIAENMRKNPMFNSLHVYCLSLYFVIIIWWLVASITLVTGHVSDGNGAPLKL